MDKRSILDNINKKAGALLKKGNRSILTSSTNDKGGSVSLEKKIIQAHLEVSSDLIEAQGDSASLVRLEIKTEIPTNTTLNISITTDENGNINTLEKEAHTTQQKPEMQPVLHKRNVPAINAFSKAKSWLPLAFAGLIYLFVVGYKVDQFPIYFFTDEAVHTNLAADFIRDGFQNYQKEFLPTYFSLGPMFALNGVSVYIQIIPFLLFGKSVFVARMVSGFITLIGAIFIALTLRDIFEIKHYWIGVLLPLTNAAWFLHARTAFEYMEVSSFFAGFLYFYLRYRQGTRNALFGAVIMGALVFYTHGLGQMLMGITALSLLVIDIKYHLKPENKFVILQAFLLTTFFAVPFLRYYYSHQDAISAQLQQRGSYWSDPQLGTLDKLSRFGWQYISGLNPQYWFFSTNSGLIRHFMKDYTHLWLPALPFLAIGLFQVGRKITDARYYSVLIALLACPVPASLVETSVTRMLWVIIPISILVALGLSYCIDWLAEHTPRFKPYLGPSLFLSLTIPCLLMLNDSLTNGPTWFDNYSLYGLQYGAKQVFADNILTELETDPQIEFRVSPNWANGTDQLLKFFIPPEYNGRIRLDTIDNYMNKQGNFSPETVFVLIPDEFNLASGSPIFDTVQVLKIINYPNGKPGFYFVKVNYSDQADAIFAQEALERQQPMHDTYQLGNEQLDIIYSRIEAGQLADIFDDNPVTLIRGLEANPFIVDITFSPEKEMSGINLTIAHIPDFTVTINVFTAETDEPFTYTENYVGMGGDPTITLHFNEGQLTASRLVLEITDNRFMETTKTHIRELKFIP